MTTAKTGPTKTFELVGGRTMTGTILKVTPHYDGDPQMPVAYMVDCTNSDGTVHKGEWVSATVGKHLEMARLNWTADAEE